MISIGRKERNIELEGQHYNNAGISSQVTSDTAIWMVLTIDLVAGYNARVINVKDTVLKGEFENNKEFYMIISEWFKKFCPNAKI